MTGQPITRTSDIFLHIGAKKTGKTQATLSAVVDMWRKQRKPALVFDIGRQSEYDSFHQISVEDVPQFAQLAAQQAYPFFACRDVQDFDEFFEAVNTYVRNSFVVLEDATSYMTGNMSQSAKRLVYNSRNTNNDYWINLHSLADPAPVLLKNAEVYVLRRTTDVDVPTKVPVRHKIEQAMAEIQAENQRLYPGKDQPKLAFRVINITEA